jgi:hypothetical protein
MMSRYLNRSSLPSLCAALLCLGACSTELVPASVPLQGTAETTFSEALLLDVGLRIFTPVAEPATESDSTLQNLRRAEGHYLSWQLGQTLQASAQWGAIRLNPFMPNYADLMIEGAVVQSDGETLRVHVKAFDATGREWIDRDYFQLASANSYVTPLGDAPPLPYQSLLNEVANDLLLFREQNVDAASRARIRQVAALNFAAEFAPDVYGAYLVRTRSGEISFARLPAANDPVFAEIETIRNRNELFLDAVQGQYTVFARTVDEPYRRFLARSNLITRRINAGINTEDEEARRGASMVVGPDVNSRNVEGTRIAVTNRRSNRLNRGSDAALYASALADAGSSFEMALAPQTLEFAQHTVTLTGTVEEQFAQWREILREMQALDSTP